MGAFVLLALFLVGILVAAEGLGVGELSVTVLTLILTVAGGGSGAGVGGGRGSRGGIVFKIFLDVKSKELQTSSGIVGLFGLVMLLQGRHGNGRTQRERKEGEVQRGLMHE